MFRLSSARCFSVIWTVLLVAISTRAADQPAESSLKKAKPAAIVPAKKEMNAAKSPATTNQVERSESKTVITGSLIPRKVKRHGGIVDTPHNVYIIDRGEIERYGASTTADALRRLPGVTVSGR